MRSLIMIAATLLLSDPAFAQGVCYTGEEGCSGTWQIPAPPSTTCYVVIWAGDNGFKNFCLQPGQSASEQVRTGDKYCVAQGYTPNAYTCVAAPMIAQRY